MTNFETNCAHISDRQSVILTKEPTFLTFAAVACTRKTLVHHELFDYVTLNTRRWLWHNCSTNLLQDLHSSPLSTVTVPNLTNQKSVYFFSYRALIKWSQLFGLGHYLKPSSIAETATQFRQYRATETDISSISKFNQAASRQTSIFHISREFVKESTPLYWLPIRTWRAAVFEAISHVFLPLF